jgi:RNA-binding protein Nova
VPDQMVGAIVGRAGATINQIMQDSQARIQISQKGEYLPGTRNRCATHNSAQLLPAGATLGHHI